MTTQDAKTVHPGDIIRDKHGVEYTVEQVTSVCFLVRGGGSVAFEDVNFVIRKS